MEIIDSIPLRFQGEGRHLPVTTVPSFSVGITSLTVGNNH